MELRDYSKEAYDLHNHLCEEIYKYVKKHDLPVAVGVVALGLANKGIREGIETDGGSLATVDLLIAMLDKLGPRMGQDGAKELAAVLDASINKGPQHDVR